MHRRQFEDVVTIDLDQLTEAELIELHHRIVARLRFLEQTQAYNPTVVVP
jgi:hypothetical protein